MRMSAGVLLICVLQTDIVNMQPRKEESKRRLEQETRRAALEGPASEGKQQIERQECVPKEG